MITFPVQAIILATLLSMPTGGTLTIPNHKGGWVNVQVRSMRIAERRRLSVRVTDRCNSSCAAWSGYKRTCTTKGTRCGVHYAARVDGTPDRVGTLQLARRSSPTIARMFKEAFREAKPGNPLRYVSGAVLIARGEVAECE